MAGHTDSTGPGRGRRPAKAGSAPPAPRPRGAEHDGDLCVCGTCDSRLVQPIDWSLVGRTHWRVTLQCPNCGWVGTGVFDQDTVDRFDRELDRGTRELAATLARVTRACMEAELELFAHALQTDLILPSDF
jgi:hypothetical protein